MKSKRRWSPLSLAKTHPRPQDAPTGIIEHNGEIIDVGALAQAALENDRRGSKYVSAPVRQYSFKKDD